MSLDTRPPADTAYTDVDGTRIAWRSQGEGRPLLMLNRFRAAMADWDPALIDGLARNHRVITFDSAGVGASDGTVPETLEGAADVAMGLARAIGLETPHALGWSMGGMTAQILAAKYGDGLGGVVLAGTTPSFAVDGATPVPDEWLNVATTPSYTVDDMLFLFYTDTDAGRLAGRSSLARIGGGDPVAGATPKTTLQTMAGQGVPTRKFFAGEDGAFRMLKDIKVPVLVANGDRDRAFAVENSVALAKAIPGAQLSIYPDAGHAFHFQYADRFADEVTDFLKVA
ncbi:alpha/beta hydrolase [Primorskyibacter flagellatus]|uniref:Alpha/beta hydrolase n=1 Tax=Primorskyibacter flagellatus TaxID=1387277 RepID=A0A917A9N8_9RHOB|nr:alpha/beta hydrolase [Primorskyibacter flagellatus]GGE36806.1 alpha/beta hydrolase [Primorskyibacter flagellatus]